ncbi:ankyrin [Whalleya microplaca]|nr:ankyrin [Whalleya microplaca]
MADAPAPERGTRCSTDVHSTGITELYVPPSPVIDICFVHGFTGHPERTWRSKKRTKREAENGSSVPPKRRLTSGWRAISRVSVRDNNNLAEQAVVKAEHVYWPRDLVPEIMPQARVLTFGYDTHIKHSLVGPISHNRLSDHAQDFLAALEAVRMSDGSRPLLFIAHSLGGLLVKDMLSLSRSYEQDQPDRASIYHSTVGLVFFGTPHGGANPLNIVHETLVGLTKTLGWKVNEEIVRILMPAAEQLDQLRHGFRSMTYEKHWDIYTFQEEFGLRTLGSKKVVEDCSSCINDNQHERVAHIQADHVDMCRFDGVEDPEFHKVAAVLRRVQDTLHAKVSSVSIVKQPATWQTIPSDQRERLLEKLRFEQISTRYATLKQAHNRTCQWLPKSSLYKKWSDPRSLAEHHGFLWIKGKPGAGKSILMKYLVDKHGRSEKNRTMVSFFFNARGSELERSTEGLYRSLLFQLFENINDLDCDVEPLQRLLQGMVDPTWPIETLKEVFSSAIENLGTRDLICFIDALDECPEDDIRDMVSFFEDVCESAVEADCSVRVCFSSRHYPHITIRNGLHLILEDLPDHSNDIRNYICSKLRITQGQQSQDIEEEILQRSSNIFLWAALVVDILNKEHDKGGNATVHRRLQQIPTGLHQLFQDMLTRDNDNIDELILCLQWILFAKRPLRPEELYYAMQLGIDSNLSDLDAKKVPMVRINRFNLNASKGLTEVTKKSPTVQFIHESVRDYLLRENGLQTLIQHRVGTGGNIDGVSHDTLKHNCLKQLVAPMPVMLPSLPDPLPKASSSEAAELRDLVRSHIPFLDYAVHNVLGHADSAQASGLDQAAFLSTFPREQWIILDNLFQKYEIRRHTRKASLLYLFAEHNLASLINHLPYRHDTLLLSNDSERYPYPIVAAMALGHREAIRAIAIEMAKANATSTKASLVPQICEELSDISHVQPDRDHKRWKNTDILPYIVELGSFSLINALWDRLGRPIKDLRQVSESFLVQSRSLKFTKFLICRGADINATNDVGDTALMCAAKNDAVDIAEYLLRTGAALGLCNKSGDSALDLAESTAMAKLLINLGLNRNTCHQISSSLLKVFYQGSPWLLELLAALSDDQRNMCVSATNRNGNNILHIIAKDSSKSSLLLLQFLIHNTEELVNSKNHRGQTPLSIAAQYGLVENVKLLCGPGKANVNLTDEEGRPPLTYASICSGVKLVETLLDAGADPTLADKEGKTPLVYAFKGGSTYATMLLDHPLVDPNCRDVAGRTQLMLIARKATMTDYAEDQVELMKILLQSPKVDTSLKCNCGMTAIHYAASSGRHDYLSTLLAMTALKPDEPDHEGRTPLIHVCSDFLDIDEQGDHLDTMKHLIETGSVDVNARDLAGKTPLWHLLLCLAHGSLGSALLIEALLKNRLVDPCITWNGYTPLGYAESKATESARKDADTWGKIACILNSYTKAWHLARI